MGLAVYRQGGHRGFAEGAGGGYAGSVSANRVRVLRKMNFGFEAAELGGEPVGRIGALGCSARDVSIKRAANLDNRRDDDRRVAEDLVEIALQLGRRIGIDDRRDREGDVPSVVKSERPMMHVLYEGDSAAAGCNADDRT